MNPFFNTKPELAKLAQDHLAHVNYVSFTKRYPKRSYRITFQFDSVQATEDARKASAEILGIEEANGIDLVKEKTQLSFVAKNREAEEQIRSALRALRPDNAPQIP